MDRVYQKSTGACVEGQVATCPYTIVSHNIFLNLKPGILHRRHRNRNCIFTMPGEQDKLTLRDGSKQDIMTEKAITEPFQTVKITSRLSFKPVLDSWDKRIREGHDGLADFYRELRSRVADIPELEKPIEDYSILQKHNQLVNMILASIFPLTLTEDEDYYAVGVPFSYRTIYASNIFRKEFLHNGEHIKVEDETAKTLNQEKICGAYQLILNKFYDKKLQGNTISVHPVKNPATGVIKYMQLELDTSFVQVKAKGPLPPITELSMISCMDDVTQSKQLREELSLDNFEFEGLIIIRIKDVTEQQIIHEIRNELLMLDSFTDAKTFEKLQGHIENLIGSSKVKIGLTPFFKINRHFVLSDQHDTGSMLFKNLASFQGKNNVYTQIESVFSEGKHSLVIPELTASTLKQYPFLQPIQSEGGKSVIIYPLLNDRELLGTLEITSAESGKLNYNYANKVLPAIPLFVLALEKSAKNLANQIANTIKEQFTAVQSSVEWRFTEAALKYITEAQKSEDAKIEPIVFENVYPLYGAIDLRNSSTERNKAIQQDLIEQLSSVGQIIKRARQISPFPLLDAIQFKIDKFINAVSNIILSDDEYSIHNFLKTEVAGLFSHLQNNFPALKKDIEQYFNEVDPVLNTWNRHRREFEQSITFLNNSVARFIDVEQHKAQKIFPHYFERFVTDGVDFNIYIGKSITPQKQYDPFYLKNMKMWQLTTLAKAAILSRQLEKRMAKPLETTQLILAHGQPISISFRTEERKFDVDGAYNIRYEIIKKRIDKVHIRDTNDRLTQPGTLAIVYSQTNEANEYMEYIDFLQQQGLLKGEVENFDLEDLQGVSGLKALRVAINFETTGEEKKEVKRISAKM